MDMDKKRIITGVAGVIWNEDGHVLIAQRPAHKPMPLLWEFPGGKIEEAETPEHALKRELQEELGLEIDLSSLKPFTFISHSYPEFHVILLFFHVLQWQGRIEAREGQDGIQWVAPQGLRSYPMPEPDEPIVELLLNAGNQFKKQEAA